MKCVFSRFATYSAMLAITLMSAALVSAQTTGTPASMPAATSLAKGNQQVNAKRMQGKSSHVERRIFDKRSVTKELAATRVIQSPPAVKRPFAKRPERPQLPPDTLATSKVKLQARPTQSIEIHEPAPNSPGLNGTPVAQGVRKDRMPLATHVIEPGSGPAGASRPFDLLLQEKLLTQRLAEVSLTRDKAIAAGNAEMLKQCLQNESRWEQELKLLYKRQAESGVRRVREAAADSGARSTSIWSSKRNR